jgi:type I restriction enzyme S subunit
MHPPLVGAFRTVNDNLQQQIEAIFNSQYAPSLRLANWTVGTVGDVVTLQRGYDLPKNKMSPGSYPVAGSTDTIFYHNDFTTEAPCIVMGRSGNIGNPRLYMKKCWAHNTTLFVKDFKSNNPYWSYYMLRTIDYSQFHGGSAVPTLNRNHVHSFEIAIPPINHQNEFAERILPLLLLIENNRAEINTLSEFRDSILPQLMSGALDVSAIQV